MSSRSLRAGKLDPDMLKQLVFSHLGSHNPRVVLGPSVGEDASVIDFGDKALVIHSDPITGAVENIGWLAVNVCANDIATRGVRPLWMLVVLLLPKNVSSAWLKQITVQIDEAAQKLDVAVVGGHTEITPGIDRPIIITTALGEASKGQFVRTSGARIGDSIIVTKGVAIEGTAILAQELASFLRTRLSQQALNRARQLVKKTSVVKDALTAVEVGGVHAMHDATEGGIAGGLQEIAWASSVGLVAYEAEIPISKETETICRILDIDPLMTIGSGALLISCESKSAQRITAALEKKRIKASIIGKIIDEKEGAYIIRRNGTKLDLSKTVKEELWKALKKRL